MRGRSLLLLLLATSPPGCGPGILDPDDADPRLQTSVVPGEGWVRVDREGFSFALPPGFEKTAAQPIDSDAANYVFGGSSLHHDYGYYTSAWSREHMAQHGIEVSDLVEQRVRIGDRTAQLVAYRSGGTYVVRAWWGSVRRSFGVDEHLLLLGETDDVQMRRTLLASIYSVRFD